MNINLNVMRYGKDNLTLEVWGFKFDIINSIPTTTLFSYSISTRKNKKSKFSLKNHNSNVKNPPLPKDVQNEVIDRICEGIKSQIVWRKLPN